MFKDYELEFLKEQMNSSDIGERMWAAAYLKEIIELGKKLNLSLHNQKLEESLTQLVKIVETLIESI